MPESLHLFLFWGVKLLNSARSVPQISKTLVSLCCRPPCSGSLCIVQTDHLPLEKLHATRLSRLPAAEERQ